MAESTKKHRTLTGTVVSDKMAKTVVVKVDRIKKHPKYERRYKVSKKYKAHDEKGDFHLGDVVIIEETRPMSRDKRWQVVKKIGSVAVKQTEEAAEKVSEDE